MFVVLTDTVDLLEAVGINQLPLGVVNTTGICDRRADEDVPDLAYRLTQRAVLTVSTAEVFQGKKKFKKKKKEIQKQRPQQLLFLFFFVLRNGFISQQFVVSTISIDKDDRAIECSTVYR